MKKAFKNLQALCSAQKEPSNIAILALLVEEDSFSYNVSETVCGTKMQLIKAVAFLIKEHPDIVVLATRFLELQEQIKN